MGTVGGPATPEASSSAVTCSHPGRLSPKLPRPWSRRRNLEKGQCGHRAPVGLGLVLKLEPWAGSPSTAGPIPCFSLAKPLPALEPDQPPC